MSFLFSKEFVHTLMPWPNHMAILVRCSENPFLWHIAEETSRITQNSGVFFNFAFFSFFLNHVDLNGLTDI